MDFRIESEEQVLDADIRKKIIEEIKGSENRDRRDEAYKRYLIFKDKTDRLVVEQLMLQFDADTIREMTYAISNVSLLKKVIGKLARVYSNGVQRTVKDPKGNPLEAVTANLQKLETALSINSEMKKANRFLKLQYNMAIYIRPVQCSANDEAFEIKVEALQPYLYDVIPDPKDPTKPLAVILSNYQPNVTSYTTLNPATAGRTTSIQPIGPKPLSDNTDEAIADQDDGRNKGEYIWWTPNFHFTTNGKGEYKGKPVNPSAETETQQHANPIGELPFVTFAIDADGKFWAEGGDDLAKGSVLINSLISQIIHIGVIQGYGQFYMKGKNLPKNFKVGPSKAILMEYEKDDPIPDVGFANANPDLDKLAKLVELYVALLLTTNNLSTTSVSTELKGGTTLASGIALMLDKAESREDVQDQEQVFKDKEPEMWRKVAKWQKAFAGKLEEKFDGLNLPTEPFLVDLSFNPPTVIQAEGEKLDAMNKRKSLGINTQLELIMMDNPGMTKEAAQNKLNEIQNEAQQMGGAMINSQAVESQNQDPANQEEPGDNPNDPVDPNAAADA